MKNNQTGTGSEILLENEHLELMILPEWGGKMASLRSKTTGTQFFQQPPQPFRTLQSPSYGDAFLPPYACGFDECFPTVSESEAQIASKRVQLPDHGELWSRPWSAEKSGDALRLWIEGEQLGYRFMKTIKLNGSSVEIGYELTSLESKPFDYIWSSHPLLEVNPEDSIYLPDEVKSVKLYWSSDHERSKGGEKLPWPELYGKGPNQSTDFSKVPGENASFAAKLFTKKLTEGKAAIFRKKANETLQFSFNTREVPYLGVWLCYNGWPENEAEKDITIALEPCSAPVDALSEGIDMKQASAIDPGETVHWSMDLQIFQGLPSINL